MQNNNEQRETIWRVIYLHGVRSIYEVSNDGDVRNRITGEMLTKGKNDDGSLSVTLKCSNRVYRIRVHQLVARAFIPNPRRWICVLHRDGIKTHNYDYNLAWDHHRAWME